MFNSRLCFFIAGLGVLHLSISISIVLWTFSCEDLGCISKTTEKSTEETTTGFEPPWLNLSCYDCWNKGDLGLLYKIHQDIMASEELQAGGGNKTNSPLWLSEEYKSNWTKKSTALEKQSMLYQLCHRYFVVTLETELSDLFPEKNNFKNTVKTWDYVRTIIDFYKALSNLNIGKLGIRKLIASECFENYYDELNYEPDCTDSPLRKIMNHSLECVEKLKFEVGFLHELFVTEPHVMLFEKMANQNSTSTTEDSCPLVTNINDLLSPFGQKKWHGKNKFESAIKMFDHIISRILTIEDALALGKTVPKKSPAWLEPYYADLWNLDDTDCLEKMKQLLAYEILVYIVERTKVQKNEVLPEFSVYLNAKTIRGKKMLAEEVMCHAFPLCDMYCF